MRELTFTVPLIPPSVNHYKMPRKGGGWYITKESQAFIEAVAIFARQATIKPCAEIPAVLPVEWIPIVAGRFYDVIVDVHQQEKKFLRGDSDNMEKLLFDSLTKAGVIRDDRYITRHTHRRIPVPTAHEECTHYTIRGIDEP